MSLDKATVARVANLARIAVPDEQLEPLAKELAGILGWIEQLGEVPTDGVEPLRSVMEIERPWRVDVVDDGARADAVLGNAPKRHEGYFVVPKVVE